MHTLFLRNNNINQAIEILKSGGIGIFPTDTVYGIGCDFSNTVSLNNLYKAKVRDYSKPINILVSRKDMIYKYVKNVNSIEETLINKFWPGPLTIIFNKTDLVPDLLTAGLNTVGIRMPNNKVCLDLIDTLGKPLATSSANISNEKPTNYINENLIKKFKNKVDFILDSGKIDSGISSTIIKVESNKINILREGPISFNDIMEVINNVR